VLSPKLYVWKNPFQELSLGVVIRRAYALFAYFVPFPYSNMLHITTFYNNDDSSGSTQHTHGVLCAGRVRKRGRQLKKREKKQFYTLYAWLVEPT
jgi:hypothetical protein